MIRIPGAGKNLPIPADSQAQLQPGEMAEAARQDGAIPVPASLLEAVTDFVVAQGGGEGHFPMPVAGIAVMRSYEQRLPMRQVYKPSLCLVVQGAKEILFDGKALRYAAMECLVVSMDVPASGRVVEASAQTPYIGITIDLDLAVLRELMEQDGVQTAPAEKGGGCLFVGKVQSPLADCVERLIRLASTPEALRALFPAMMREICYWLLASENGGELRRLSLPGSASERVSRAIALLHTRFAQNLRVSELAGAAGMSQSSFHQHFKVLTSMTPLQYQKQLRLIEARRRMVMEAVNVSEAAHAVGYESASQFSREYTRTFGMAPKRDVAQLRSRFAGFADLQARASGTGQAP